MCGCEIGRDRASQSYSLLQRGSYIAFEVVKLRWYSIQQVEGATKRFGCHSATAKKHCTSHWGGSPPLSSTPAPPNKSPRRDHSSRTSDPLLTPPRGPGLIWVLPENYCKKDPCNFNTEMFVSKVGNLCPTLGQVIASRILYAFLVGETQHEIARADFLHRFTQKLVNSWSIHRQLPIPWEIAGVSLAKILWQHPLVLHLCTVLALGF